MIKKSIITLLRFYQKVLSPDQGFLVKYNLKRTGHFCTFYPSCSEYAVLVIEKHGVLHGGLKAVRRILRCHPWQKEHIDLP